MHMHTETYNFIYTGISEKHRDEIIVFTYSKIVNGKKKWEALTK